jgi:hypothetical protein
MAVAVHIAGARGREQRKRTGRLQDAKHLPGSTRVEMNGPAAGRDDIRDAVLVRITGRLDGDPEAIVYSSVRLPQECLRLRRENVDPSRALPAARM